MRKRRCSLCGGRLVNNRCVECGLDNSQCDAQYKNRTYSSSCENQSMPHVHEDPKKEQKSRKKQQIQKRQQPQVIQKQYGRKAKNIFIIFVVVVICIGLLGQIIESFQEDVLSQTFFGEEEAEPEIYSGVTRELSETGSFYDEILEPGNYIVGVHIPEGRYCVELMEGEVGYVSITDWENAIHHFIHLGEYEGAVIRQEDVRLYEGAVVEVSLDVSVEFCSENAQTALHGVENTVKEGVFLSKESTAGRDFPAGCYDIYYTPSTKGEYGEMTCTPSIEDMENGMVEQTLFFDSGYGEQTYHNMRLAEGTTVTFVNLGGVTLIPSPIVQEGM